MAVYSLEDLLYLMTRLRDPQDGCPWDRQQDFNSIVPHTLEESYELADAIASGDFQHIKEELGDVLFQVVFYSQLGKEQQHFDFSSVISTLVEKLLRRHPHVFPEADLHKRFDQSANDKQNGEGQHIDAATVKRNWETIKAAERGLKQQKSILDDVPLALPALSRAAKLQKRAANVGFDWNQLEPVIEKLQEEIAELIEAKGHGNSAHIEEELGDVLFSVVNLARHLSIEPEAALRKANHKFESRFSFIEQALERQGSSPERAGLKEMDQLWDEAKKQGL